MTYRGKAIHVMAMTLDSGKVVDQKKKKNKQTRKKKQYQKNPKNPQKYLTTMVPNPSYGLEQRVYILSFE